MDLIDTCTFATGRKYPEGYGFALAYLTKTPGPDHFDAMQNSAWKAVKNQAKRGNIDAAKFVTAYTESRMYTPARGWRWWLIEAAQLVLAEAHRGSADAAKTLRMWNHPGY